MDEQSRKLMDALARPFEAGEVKWKAQVARGNRAMAVAYVDARVVAERLDEVFGLGGWQDSYELLPNGSVLCHLQVKSGGEWVSRCDVGSTSDQPDQGDRMKSAFSDALKRAAVKLGVGRYLYRLPSQWVEYDPQKKQIVSPPKLPPWAVPPPRDRGPGPEAPAGPVGQAGASTTAGGIATRPIGREQWEELKAALAASGASQRRLLDNFGARKPGELVASNFAEALRLAKSPPQEWLASAAGGGVAK